MFASMRASAPKPAKAADAERLASLEEKLGTNWLNKIGTAAFVIGVALLINYSLHYFGPAGKIALGYGIAILFLALGVFGERSERYRIGARAVLGGGWALAYFTTYALHNIATVRLIDDPVLGFVLLFVVAAAMVAHSLRYHSEVTTGFAFLLAYLSVAVSVIPFGALIASALLGASLVFILRQRRWYAIEPFAVIATYVVHWIWLTQIYQRLGGHKPFPEFTASAAILTIYWLIFIASYFLRADASTAEKRWLTASFLLNALGYLVVLHQQSFHPEWRFRFLLFAGAVYLVVAYLARRQQRQLGYLLATTLGAGLLVAAIPYKYSGARLEILWLVEIEALFAVGWKLADRHLRRLGWAASIVLCGYVFLNDITARLDKWHPPDHGLGWLLLLIAVAFYLNAEWRRLLRDTVDAFEDAALTISPIVATFFLLAASWVGLHWMLAGFFWTLSAGALLEIARFRRDSVLRYCSYAAAASAVIRLVFVNIPGTTTYYGYSVRLMTVAASVAIFYLMAPRSATEPPVPPKSAQSKFTDFRQSPVWQGFLRFGGFPMLYAGSATLLLSLLLWEEVANAGVALAWGVLAVALIETGEEFKGLGLIGQGRLLLIAAFATNLLRRSKRRHAHRPANIPHANGHSPRRNLLLGRLKVRRHALALHFPLVRRHWHRRARPLRAASLMGRSSLGAARRRSLRPRPAMETAHHAPAVLHLHRPNRRPLRLRQFLSACPLAFHQRPHRHRHRRLANLPGSRFHQPPDQRIHSGPSRSRETSTREFEIRPHTHLDRLDRSPPLSPLLLHRRNPHHAPAQHRDSSRLSHRRLGRRSDRSLPRSPASERALLSLVRSRPPSPLRRPHRPHRRLDARPARPHRLLHGPRRRALDRQLPLRPPSRITQEGPLMPRRIALIAILVAGGAVLFLLQRHKVTAPITPAPALYLVADAEREAERLPLEATQVSDQEEMRVGAQMSNNVCMTRGTHDSPEVIKIRDYVSKVGQSLTPNVLRTGIHYTFCVENNPYFVNAYALPGGYVVIGRGLLSISRIRRRAGLHPRPRNRARR